MNKVFADTFYFIALANPFDSFHKQVTEVSKSNNYTIFTSDEILIEFLTYFSAAKIFTKSKAIQITNFILSSQEICVLSQSRDSFLKGLELYKNRLDKGYSLTDCISMTRMKENNLNLVLTKDSHFKQEGFNIVF